MISKTIATIVTYPYQTVKTRLQAKGTYNGMIDTFIRILTEEGFMTFYNGVLSKIVQSVFTAAFLFSCQENLVQILTSFYKTK